MRQKPFTSDDPRLERPAQYLEQRTASIAVYSDRILEANDAALLAFRRWVDLPARRGHDGDRQGPPELPAKLLQGLRPNSAPRFDTISRVCAALGVRLGGPGHPYRQRQPLESQSADGLTAPPIFETMAGLGREPCLARIPPGRRKP